MKGDSPEGGYASDRDLPPPPKPLVDPGTWRTTGSLLIPVYVALGVSFLAVGVMLVISRG